MTHILPRPRPSVARAVPGGRRRQPEAGVTLIEMMIALALFAVIGSAGFAMLDQVLRTQSATEGRLERLSGQERALHVMLADFAMAEPHSLTSGATGVALNRSNGDGSLRLGYRVADSGLHRDIAGVDGSPLADQMILTGIDRATWRFLTPEGAWSDIWPPDHVQTLTTPANPRAVELVITLPGQAGHLRLIAPLPADLD